ncbi:MAG: hypothetical protein B6I20_05505 [Bacteroidetes bacterium 4572_117]|nr:MAG: hypothetical protein B6I20_05505 [Bacteroidetes bacterium 4572_117]
MNTIEFLKEKGLLSEGCKELDIISGGELFVLNDLLDEYAQQQIKETENTFKTKYEKCINVIRRFDAGIIGMYNL